MDRKEIVAAFRNVLDESKIAHKADASIRPGSIVITFGMKCGGGMDWVWGLFEFKGTGVRFYGVAPDLAEAKNLPETFKLLAMVNRDMAAGCFEFETASRQIRFRHFADCLGFATVPRDFVLDTLLLPFKMFARYGDSFVALDEGFPEATIAFGTARKGDEAYPPPERSSDTPGSPAMDQKAISSAVKRYLDAAHVQYATESTPDGTTFFCPKLRIENSLESVSQTIKTWGTHMAIYAHCPVKAAPEHVAETAKFLALANYGLILGNFDLDVDTGDIHYRHFFDCGGFEELSEEMLCRSCPIPYVMLLQYGDAIAAVATGRSDAETALAQAKKNPSMS